jgi:hypothetical protein
LARPNFAISVAIVLALAALLFGAHPLAAAAMEHGSSPPAFASGAWRGTTFTGLVMKRSWRIPRSDQRRLIGTIELKNTDPASVTQYLTEALPTASLATVRFAPRSLAVQLSPGLARLSVTIPSQASVKIRYDAKLTKEQGATAKSRLSEVRDELGNALTGAQPTPEDLANAAWKTRYVGQVRIDEETIQRGSTDDPRIGVDFTLTLNLTPVSAHCTVPAQGCEFTAIETAYTTPPKLDKLIPAGTTLTREATSVRNTLDDGAVRCLGTPAPSSAERKWVIEPTKSALTPSGWQVTEVHYSMLEDLTGEPLPAVDARCAGATAHTAVSGTLALTS